MNETSGQPPAHAAIDETVSARRELTAVGAFHPHANRSG